MRAVTTEDVLGLMDAGFTSAALGAAMELGLFWILDERPMDAGEVARALGIPGTRCRYWLDLLESVGLLERTPGGYAPSAATRTAILDAHRRDSWAFLAREIRHRMPAVRDLALRIRDPGSTWEAQGLAPPDYFAQIAGDPVSAERFTRMLLDLHGPLAEAVADVVDAREATRMMDLGGGSGVASMALLRRNPQLAAVVVDHANVCEAGQRIAKERAIEDRLTWHAADLSRDPLPGGFDLVLECDVGLYTEALFRRVRDALAAGGRFVIVDQLSRADGVSPPSRLQWAFQNSMRDPDFRWQTIARVHEVLRAAGFRSRPETALAGSGPGSERFGSDWIVIEAVPE